MFKLIIKNDRKFTDVKTASMQVEFDLGEIVDESKLENDTVTLDLNVLSNILYSEKLLYQLAQREDEVGFKKTLEEYFSLKLLDKIGIGSVPITLNKEGKIKGIKQGVAIVWER